MSFLTRRIILDTLIKHETLTIDDIADPVNLGMSPDMGQLGFLLSELQKAGHISSLRGVLPKTYTITEKGIDEGKGSRHGGMAY